MELKRRMGEVKEVLVMHNFDFVWEKRTSSMNPETARITQIGHIFVFYTAKVASESDPLPNGGQRVVVEFKFQGGGR